MKWILIASAIVIGLLVIFILYDQRKNIFKKRVKKAKEPKQETPKAPEKPKEEPNETITSRIFSYRALIICKSYSARIEKSSCPK